MKVRHAVLCGLVSSICIASFSSIALAQRIKDVEADPVHYKVELDNDCVYVTRASFGPHEKMPTFFDGKQAVIVSLTNSDGLKITFPDGHSIVTPPWRAGAVFWAREPARQLQENPFDTPLEFIAIEPKPKGCN